MITEAAVPSDPQPDQPSDPQRSGPQPSDPRFSGPGPVGAHPFGSCPREQRWADPVQDADALLGRGREYETLREALFSQRVIAVTGTAGVGKSRLVAAVSDSVSGQRRIMRVDLGALLDPELLAGTLAYALGVPDRPGVSELGGLARALGGEPTLLVLDGTERLRGEGGPVVEYLVDTCPELVVLAAGRAAPGTRYERVHRLDPLAEGPATALLRLRAHQFGATSLAPSGSEHLDALPLCHLLDRNPLAIELAASHLVETAPRQLMSEVSRPCGLLSLKPAALPSDVADIAAAYLPSRSLRSAAETSYDLCSPTEQLLWARLSMVPVGFDFGEAQQACADPELGGQVLEQAWDALIRGSVLVPYGAGSRRYRLPFLLRAFGRERLRPTR